MTQKLKVKIEGNIHMYTESFTFLVFSLKPFLERFSRSEINLLLELKNLIIVPNICKTEVLKLCIAKLSPSPNSKFSWGLSWLYSQLIQPSNHPYGFDFAFLQQWYLKESCWYIWVGIQNVFEPDFNLISSPVGLI